MNNEQTTPSTASEPHHFMAKGTQQQTEKEFWDNARAALRNSEKRADEQRVQAFSSPHFETDREHDKQYDDWCKEQGIRDLDDLPF